MTPRLKELAWTEQYNPGTEPKRKAESLSTVLCHLNAKLMPAVAVVQSLTLPAAPPQVWQELIK